MYHRHLPSLLLPQTPSWDWPGMLSIWVPSDPFQPEPGTPEYYRVKHAIALYTEADTIAEIGVRAGYSAAAFLSAGYASQYVGIDRDMGTDGGVQGYCEHAKEILKGFPNCHIEILLVDSQQMTPQQFGSHDLVHVDGDHSYQGAYNDVALALKSGSRFILVDDVDMMPDVSRGTIDALAAHPHKAAWYVSDNGYRGNVLIENV